YPVQLAAAGHLPDVNRASWTPATRRLPSFDQAAATTPPRPVTRPPAALPVAASQSRTPAPPSVGASRFPAGGEATERRGTRSPTSIRRSSLPVAASQTRTVPSNEADAMVLPSGA